MKYEGEFTINEAVIKEIIFEPVPVVLFSGQEPIL